MITFTNEQLDRMSDTEKTLYFSYKTFMSLHGDNTECKEIFSLIEKTLESIKSGLNKKLNYKLSPGRRINLTEGQSKDLLDVRKKYLQLGKEIEKGESHSNLMHSHSKLGIFLSELFGYKIWNPEGYDNEK